MTKSRLYLTYAAVLTGLAATAVGFASPQAASSHQPHAGQQQRAIKALSADDIDGYLKGKGMGFAKSDELNHYPSPLHLRQMAAGINLTAKQLADITPIETHMKAAAKRLDHIVLEKEESLDALFASGGAEPDAVRRLTADIGQLRDELQAVYLMAHLQVRPLLGPHQIAICDRLRGYTSGGSGTGESGHSRHGKH